METGSLLKAEDYGHKYPYDWRTKKPTIFRATDQWFASVEGFRDNVMKAIDTVRLDNAIFNRGRMMRVKKKFIILRV
jgi:isoleucyl-tRNA synthetase